MKAIFDPTNSFPNVSDEKLLQACGLIPVWVLEWRGLHSETRTLREHLEECYPFGMEECTLFTINSDASLSYEGDPDEKPILKLEFPDGTEIYQYLHAWVMIVEPGKPNFVTRLD